MCTVVGLLALVRLYLSITAMLNPSFCVGFAAFATCSVFVFTGHLSRKSVILYFCSNNTIFIGDYWGHRRVVPCKKFSACSIGVFRSAWMNFPRSFQEHTRGMQKTAPQSCWEFFLFQKDSLLPYPKTLSQPSTVHRKMCMA